MDLLIDLYQQGRIAQAQATAEQAKDVAKHFRWELDDLRRKTDALTITCQALWEILRAQTGLRDDQILAKMQEIDARDGRVDGKISTTLAECPKCRRKSNSTRKCCLYCGTMLPLQNVFGRD
jgi:hypothetical protein